MDAVARQEPESCGRVTLAPPLCGTQCHRKLLDTAWRKQNHILWKDRGKGVDRRNMVLRVNLCHYSAQEAKLILGFLHGLFCWENKRRRRTERAGCARGTELLITPFSHLEKILKLKHTPNVQASNKRELQVVRFGNPCPSHPTPLLNMSAALEFFWAPRALQTLCSRVIISLSQTEKVELPGASVNKTGMWQAEFTFWLLGLSF